MAQSVDETSVIVKGSVSTFSRMMKKMVNNKEFSDMTFLIGSNKTQIFAHRCIISARCAVFQAMLADESNVEEKDTPYVISDVSPEIFLDVLEFFYTNCVTLTTRNVIDILINTLEYGIDDLRDLCVDFLAANLSISSACEAMQLAVAYNQNDLKEKAAVFIDNNTVEVLSAKSFQGINEDALVSILISNQLTIDEMDLYRALRQWAAVNSEMNGKKIHEVARHAIKHIRLPLLSAEELNKLKDEDLQDGFIPAYLFTAAWRVHELKQGDKDNATSICRRGTIPREHHKYLANPNND